ncbi:MAG TPA: PQQ-binding-like beta-propeller repeat protein, partial [Phycisphaerae bacterium]|nr:PQQ-binding-like beta-propeller repeat protein [Phycisphaerae bacterium]
MSNRARSGGWTVWTGWAALLLATAVGRAAPAEEAGGIFAATGVKGGLVVHVGCGDGTLTAAVGAAGPYLVQGLDADPKNVAAAREHVRSKGLYGAVSIAQWSGGRLPYVDNLVNLLVSEEPVKAAEGEVLRVLAPGGVAYVRDGGKWARTVKARPEAIDEWTHYMHDPGNTGVARDSVVGPPRRVQWMGSPRWSRHHDNMASMSAMVTAAGRVFYIIDEGSRASIELPANWALIARDAFNGTVLWRRQMGTWHTHLWPLKSGPAQLPRRLVAVGDRVYATLSLDAPLTALDAATGETVRTYEGTASTREIIASDGVLFLLVAPDDKEPAAWGDFDTLNDTRRTAGTRGWDAPKRCVMAIRAEGAEPLWRKETPAAHLTLAADAKHVYFHDGVKVVALDRATGEPAWQSKPVPVYKSFGTWFAPTLEVIDGVVLFAGGENMVPHRGGKDTVTALSAETGRTMWTGPHGPSGYQSPEDLFVIDGVVWSGATTTGGYDGKFTGLDLKTGQVRSEFLPDVKAYWFHHRCYRGKATEKFILTSRTGVEFIDPVARTWQVHQWTRGGCLYGVMPANGLLYCPPHSCACYPEAKLFGLNALAPADKAPYPTTAPDEDRLLRGPAYGTIGKADPAGEGAWLTYRGDAARSGSTPSEVPAKARIAWEAAIGGRLSAVTISGDKVYVAEIDAHTVHALDAGTGEKRWSFTADGRVDSPPTLHGGSVLFGSADGHVYCLRASDGTLAWRFQAAPQRRSTVAYEQLESVWPVHGSVLVRGGEVWCVAGRSMFLDGGMRLIRLDPATGRKLAETVLDDRDPLTGGKLQDRHQGLNMPVALPDVLSADEKYVYMRSQVFDGDGNRPEIGPHSGNAVQQGAAQHGEGVHLFAPMGFLDGSWLHRSYWVYGRSFAGGASGYFQAGRYAPAGRIVVFDASHVYAFGRKSQYYRWTTPLEYRLYAADKAAPKVAAPAGDGGNRGGSRIVFANTASLNPTGKALAVMAWIRPEKPNGAILARGGNGKGYALVLYNGQPRFIVRAGGEARSVTADVKVARRWAHVAGVLTKEGQLQVYVDGKLAGTAASDGLIRTEPVQDMQIGSDDGSTVGEYTAPYPYTGLVDEVRVHYGTVTAEEIAAHAKGPEGNAAAGATLVLACSFDDGKATDASGKGNHGQVDGAASIAGRFGKAMRFTGAKAGGIAGPGFSHVKPIWEGQVPLLARGMVLAGKTLFVAGPPDVLDEEDAQSKLRDPRIQADFAAQAEAMEGKRGALLLAVDPADGKTLGEVKLASPPVWDGLSAA